MTSGYELCILSTKQQLLYKSFTWFMCYSIIKDGRKYLNGVIGVGSLKSHHLVGVMTPRNQVEQEVGYLFLGSIEEPVNLTI